MFISHKFKTIFIHIQKTGGNSVEKLFNKYDKNIVRRVEIQKNIYRSKHCFALDVKNAVDDAIFKKYLKFAIVRNPFDRLVSWWEMMNHQTGILNDVMTAVRKEANNFDEFCILPKAGGGGLFERFYVNQMDYLTQNGEILVDHILRFENFSHDLNNLMKLIGLKNFWGNVPQIPHINKSKREKSYQVYYTPELQNMIADRYKKDLNFFNYQF